MYKISSWNMIFTVSFWPIQCILAIATNILQRIKTAFVLQGYKYLQFMHCAEFSQWQVFIRTIIGLSIPTIILY